MEYTLTQLADQPEGSYLLIDIRDEGSYDYGSIDGAVNMPDVLGEAQAGHLPRDRKLVLMCMHGLQSMALAEQLRQMGYDACNLQGGYGGWLRELTLRGEDRSREIEKTIIKRRVFRERLFSRFTKAIMRYELVQPGDKIAVCISGGKDSMLMAKLFQELHRQHKFPFELVFLVMDPGYNELNRLVIEKNAAMLGVPGGAICTVRRRNLAATRSPWDITMTT